MSFETIQITERGPCVKGITSTGRRIELTLVGGGEQPRFEAVVHPFAGHDQMGDRAIDIELSRVMEEEDAISVRLGPLLAAGGGETELLRAAASILDRREVEPELIEALLDAAPSPAMA